MIPSCVLTQPSTANRSPVNEGWRKEMVVAHAAGFAAGRRLALLRTDRVHFRFGPQVHLGCSPPVSRRRSCLRILSVARLRMTQSSLVDFMYVARTSTRAIACRLRRPRRRHARATVESRTTPSTPNGRTASAARGRVCSPSRRPPLSVTSHRKCAVRAISMDAVCLIMKCKLLADPWPRSPS